MMQFPRFNSRRHLDDQWRERVAPADDAKLGLRVPVEVLRNQMALYGMHSVFHPNGSSMAAIRQVKKKTGFVVTACRRQQVDTVQRKSDIVKQQGLMDITELARRHQCSRATLHGWLKKQGIQPVCKADRRLFYLPEEFDGFKLQGPHKKQLVLSDGRAFGSIRELCRSIGKSDNFIHGRLKRLNLPATVENIEKVMHMRRMHEGKYAAVKRWCEANGVCFGTAHNRAKYNHVALTVERCVEWYGGKRRPYRRRAA